MWQLTMYCQCFEPRDTSNLISIFSFTLAMRRHLIRLASAPFTFGLAKFGWATFAVCNVWQRSKKQNLRCVSETSVSILSRLWTKVHEIFRRHKRPLVLSNDLAQLSMSCFVQKIFNIQSRSRRKTKQVSKVYTPF